MDVKQEIKSKPKSFDHLLPMSYRVITTIYVLCISELCKENFADEPDMTEEEVEEELAIIR